MGWAIALLVGGGLLYVASSGKKDGLPSLRSPLLGEQTINGLTYTSRGTPELGLVSLKEGAIERPLMAVQKTATGGKVVKAYRPVSDPAIQGFAKALSDVGYQLQA